MIENEYSTQQFLASIRRADWYINIEIECREKSTGLHVKFTMYHLPTTIQIRVKALVDAKN